MEETNTAQAGTSETQGTESAEAKTFSGYSSLNRSTTPCHFLLPSEADEQCRQV